MTHPYESWYNNIFHSETIFCWFWCSSLWILQRLQIRRLYYMIVSLSEVLWAVSVYSRDIILWNIHAVVLLHCCTQNRQTESNLWNISWFLMQCISQQQYLSGFNDGLRLWWVKQSLFRRGCTWSIWDFENGLRRLVSKHYASIMHNGSFQHLGAHKNLIFNTNYIYYSLKSEQTFKSLKWHTVGCLLLPSNTEII